MPDGSTSGPSTPAASRTGCSRQPSTPSGTSTPIAGWMASGRTPWRREAGLQRRLHGDDREAAHGIFWSDGVEFTAADVVYTVETQIEHTACAGVRRSAHRRRRRDARSLYGRLQAEGAELALPRPFHGALERHLDHAQARLREGRGPAEVRLQQAGLARRLRAAQLRSNGSWYIWQLRDDWQRTTIGHGASPGRNTSSIVDPGPPDKRVIEQINHDLDVINDVAPEGMFTLPSSRRARRLVQGLPLCASRSDAAGGDLQHQNALFKNKDVRWALAC